MKPVITKVHRSYLRNLMGLAYTRWLRSELSWQGTHVDLHWGIAWQHTMFSRHAFETEAVRMLVGEV